MGKRGPKPKGKVKIKWSSDFAYAIGLIVTDGNLSKNGYRISFTSKDVEQVKNLNQALGINIKIGVQHSGSTSRKAHRIQFKDVLFYHFLSGIGISPAKSKTIGAVRIPKVYFFDYLRGCFDGDGSVYSYWDKRWQSSFMFYISFVSASQNHVLWLQNEIFKFLGVRGNISKADKSSIFQLKYAKKDSLKIINKMYENKNGICLNRKKLKIKQILAIVSGLS